MSRMNRTCKICATKEENTIQWHRDKWCGAGDGYVIVVFHTVIEPICKNIYKNVYL
jgi:hypothetical protein